MDVYREDGDDSIDVFKACRNKMEIRCEQGVPIQANTLAGSFVPNDSARVLHNHLDLIITTGSYFPTFIPGLLSFLDYAATHWSRKC